jgi:hypothetical protein
LGLIDVIASSNGDGVNLLVVVDQLRSCFAIENRALSAGRIGVGDDTTGS